MHDRPTDRRGRLCHAMCADNNQLCQAKLLLVSPPPAFQRKGKMAHRSRLHTRHRHTTHACTQRSPHIRDLSVRNTCSAIHVVAARSLVDRLLFVCGAIDVCCVRLCMWSIARILTISRSDLSMYTSSMHSSIHSSAAHSAERVRAVRTGVSPNMYN